MLKIGFIGTGNMGGALAKAAAQNKDNNILLADAIPEKAIALGKEINGTPVAPEKAVKEADILFLGVKPQMLPDLLEQIKGELSTRTDAPLLVTMAAGTPIKKILKGLEKEYAIIRIMPNMPVAVGQGMILYATKNTVENQVDMFLEAMKYAGRFSALEEKLIDAGSAVSGCGPAFAQMFIEALADGGVACGLPRDKAQEFAAQMLAGSAILLLNGNKHPGQLKDAVCSPGGTTIQGVRVLEEKGFRGAIFDAVIAAYEKNFDL